ncbi:MAG TPA: hypothetical protein VFW89_07775 [Gemmatimonadaceae bacterium]|nr:hypothetical protein [Gemmatimonadaceae bacterium]
MADTQDTGTGPTHDVGAMVSNATQEAGAHVGSGIQAGRNRAVDTLSDVARALQSSAAHMRDEQHRDDTARYVDRAGQQVQRFADYIRTADPGDIADRTETFARRQPAAFLGGAFALGLAGARFLKSSRRQEQRDRWQERASRGAQSSSRTSSRTSGVASRAMGYDRGERGSMYDQERPLAGSERVGPVDTVQRTANPATPNPGDAGRR